MKDDSYARFLRSELFAQQVKYDISKVTHRKDYGLMSWYKTSLKPRLSISTSKAPASRCPAFPVPDSPFPEPLRDNRSHELNQKSVRSENRVVNNLGTETRKHLPEAIGKENNHPASSHMLADSDFPLPDSLWQLSDENEYEDFFCDLLTASHKSNDRRRVGPMGRRSNSHPSLADTINQVTLTSSPSLDNIWSEIPNSSRSRKALSFRSPPPPLPPKSMRQMHPLPVPSAAPATRRTMRV